MKGTKRNDRRRLCDEDCSRRERGTKYPLAHIVALLPDDDEKLSFDNDKRAETTEPSLSTGLAFVNTLLFVRVTPKTNEMPADLLVAP